MSWVMKVSVYATIMGTIAIILMMLSDEADGRVQRPDCRYARIGRRDW